MLDDREILNRTFSATIIGSSPICLLRSLHLSNQGADVLLLDGKGSLGGAWATISTKKFDRVEFGAHLIANYGNLIQLFSKKYDIPFKTLRFQPIAYINSRIYNNSDWLWFQHDVKKLLKTAIKFNLYSFFIQLKRLFLYYSKSVHLNLKYNHFKKSDYIYMENGCHELIGKLVNQNISSGTIIKNNFLAKEITIDTESRSVVVSGSKNIAKSNKIIIPGNAYFAKITVDGSVYEPKTIETVFRTIYIEVESDAIIEFSYLHLFTDTIFSRVANITETSVRKPLSDKHHLIAAQLHGNLMQKISLEDAAKALFQFLVDESLIEGSSLLADRFEYSFSRHILEDSKFLKKIEKQSKGLVEILDSRTFSDSLNVYFKLLFP